MMSMNAMVVLVIFGGEIVIYVLAHRLHNPLTKLTRSAENKEGAPGRSDEIRVLSVGNICPLQDRVNQCLKQFTLS